MLPLGYSGIENQQLDPKGLPDLKESFYISEDTKESGNLYPPEAIVPRFHRTTSTYYTKMVELSQRIFRLLALALGQKQDFFDHYSGADGTISSTFGSTLRLLHYPPARNLQDGQLSCGAHTDFGTSKPSTYIAQCFLKRANARSHYSSCRRSSRTGATEPG